MRIKRKDAKQRQLEAAFIKGERQARTMIMRIIKDFNSVDDVLQDTYLKAWKNLDKFKGGSSLVTWIVAIARNESLIFLKKKRRHAVHMESLSFKAELDGHITDEPLYELLASNLETAVSEIPSDLLRIVIKKRMLGFSVREIAGQLNIHKGTVRSRYYRAKKYLLTNSKELV